MKVKLTAVLAIVSALFIGAVLWRTDSFVYGDRLNWVEAQTRTQLGAINYSLASELKSLQRVVSTFSADNFQKGKLNWNSLSPYYAAASFTVIKSTGSWALDPQLLLIKENSKAANWTKDFIKSALATVTVKDSNMKFFVKPFQDAQHGRYVALAFIEGQRAYALFGSGEIFQSMIDSQRGALSSFSIVTENGLTVGHSIPEYLGTVMRDDPIFKDAQQSGASHGASIFKLKTGDLYGMYERIPETNLLAISSAPLNETMKGRTGLWWQFLLLGCGLVAVGIAAVLAVIAPTEKQIENIEQQLVESRAASSSLVAAPEKVLALDPESVHKEKLEASMKVASALSHEMSGPLASILGYSQMILAKAPETDIVQSTDSIIRETRAAREVLNKLLSFAGEEVATKTTTKLEGPIAKALKNLEPLFLQKGVKITKTFQDTPIMDIHVDALIRALTNIFQNSVEAMERMVKKEIKIDLFADDEGTHLTIEDSGEGIEVKNVNQIFDPFFTTRSFQNHMGLGLSVALGIVKEHHGEMRVETQRARGTKVMLLFRSALQLKSVGSEMDEIPVPPSQVMKAPKTGPEMFFNEDEEVFFATELPKLAAKNNSPKSDSVDLVKDQGQPEITGKIQISEGIEETHEVTLVSNQGTEQGSRLLNSNLDFEEDHGGSPWDVNIETLLEFPEKIPPPSTSSKSSAMSVPAAMGAPTAAELASMDDDFLKDEKVTPPKNHAREKSSRLDLYQVAIPKPGKRT